MNLLHLRHFHSVARLGNITAAARELRVSQPAVSKAIRELEESLGVRLFERSRKGVELTDPGRIVLEGAGRIFSEERELETRIKSGPAKLTGSWCIGASDSLAIYWLPKIVARFKREHPELRVEVFSGTSLAIKEQLLANRCDLGLFFTPLTAREPFREQVLMPTEFWVVLAAKNPWFRSGHLPSVKDLLSKRVPRIESRHSDYGKGFPAHFHAGSLGLDGPPFLEANLHEIKKRLVLEGAGFALLTSHSVEDEVARGRLIRISTPKLLKSEVRGVWRRNQPLSWASRLFLDALSHEGSND